MSAVYRIGPDDYRFVLGPFPIIGGGPHHAESETIPAHAHDRDQLLYPGRGLLTVTTEDGVWVVPPERAVWIPAGSVHAVTAVLSTDNRSLFFEPKVELRNRGRCEVIAVSSFLHELILEVFRLESELASCPKSLKLALLADEIASAETLPLSLPHPRHPALGKLCSEFLANPVAHATIDGWSDRLNMSRRAFTRLFRTETGMSFSEWRQQACLFAALPWLAAGQSVTSVAFRLGYSGTAAFTSMFKRVVGPIADPISRIVGVKTRRTPPAATPTRRSRSRGPRGSSPGHGSAPAT